MHRVLVYAPTAATRKLYQKNLFSRDREIILAKDPVEFFLPLTTFDIDTLILVDEGKQHELNMLLEVVRRKYNQKRVILISYQVQGSRGFERHASTRAFFEVLSRDGEDIREDVV